MGAPLQAPPKNSVMLTLKNYSTDSGPVKGQGSFETPSLTSSDGAPPHIDGTAAPWQQPGGSCLHVAISYALDLNWAVFPADLRAGKKKSHKSAAYSKDGSNWGSTKDPRQISADFKRWPDAIGVPTGADNGIVVVEADTIEGHGVDGVANLDAFENQYGKLPDTLMAENPSGSVHRYYRHPGNGIRITSRSGALARGVDDKGDGGMVIAPPSKRGDGHYRWLNNLPIADTPDWLLELLIAKQGSSESEPPAEDRPPLSGSGAGSFQQLNDEAIANYDCWVPKLFPEAKRQASGGWRVSSAALGRELEEDISFAPEGIKDFGVHDMGDPRGGKRSPIDIVMEWHPDLRVPIEEIVSGGAASQFSEAVGWLWEALGHGGDWREEFAAAEEAAMAAANGADDESRETMFGGGAETAGAGTRSQTKANGHDAGEEDSGARSSASGDDAEPRGEEPKVEGAGPRSLASKSDAGADSDEGESAGAKTADAEPRSFGDGEQAHAKKPLLWIRSGNLPAVAKELAKLLAADNHFLSNGHAPVMIVVEDGMPRAIEVSADCVRTTAHELCRPVKNTKTKENGMVRTDVTLTKDIAQLYLSGLEGRWGLKTFRGIATAPILKGDGSFRVAQGYDTETGLWPPKKRARWFFHCLVREDYRCLGCTCTACCLMNRMHPCLRCSQSSGDHFCH